MSIKSFTASRNFLLSFEGGQYSMKALSRVELSGRAFGIAQSLRQVTMKIAGTIVRITADLDLAIQKYRLNNPDMMRTKQNGAKCANQGIGSMAKNGRKVRPYR
jgi:hypothetical protein